MTTNYQTVSFAYSRCSDQEQPRTQPRPVVVVGAGPVGLSAAIDLAQYGVPVVLLDDDCTLSTGSRAICFAKRTLDIFDRLGCGSRMVDKGVSWNVGRVFLGDRQLYSFDLLPEQGHRNPAFINLQQYYVEGYLLERAQALPNLEIRWKNRVTGVEQTSGAVTLRVDTPDGEYALQARYVVEADGARSPLRKLLGLESKGRTFRDRFLIADVKMEANFPSERWFWFDPPFHPNQSVLLHRQPDNVWRIDFQLGWDADPEFERQPEQIIPRVQALLGTDTRFTLEWASVYTFSCLRMERLRHGNVLFAGDSAHGVSPFGARGANSGVQDAENLAWKLAYVLDGKAPDSLLDTYASERQFAADENILNSTRATDFITPKSRVSRVFRDAVLTLAQEHEFARRLVNSGRLSVPCVLSESSLNTRDTAPFRGGLLPGTACVDAPVRKSDADTWLLARLGGAMALLVYGDQGTATSMAVQRLHQTCPELRIIVIQPAATSVNQQCDDVLVLHDASDLVRARYNMTPASAYLIRPDQHICARWRSIDTDAIRASIDRALGLASSETRQLLPSAA